MLTSLTVDRNGLAKLYEGLAQGAHEVVKETAADAEYPHIGRRTVLLLDGRIVDGDRPVPADAPASGIAAYVVFEAPAGWVELGTPAHDIAAHGKALKVGTGFAHQVHHPGSHANPFINRSFAAAVNRSQELMRRGTATRLGPTS